MKSFPFTISYMYLMIYGLTLSLLNFKKKIKWKTHSWILTINMTVRTAGDRRRDYKFLKCVKRTKMFRKKKKNKDKADLSTTYMTFWDFLCNFMTLSRETETNKFYTAYSIFLFLFLFISTYYFWVGVVGSETLIMGMTAKMKKWKNCCVGVGSIVQKKWF